MKHILLYIALISYSFQSHASDSLVLFKSLPVKARLISSDPLGNIYVVKDNNTLLRFNNDGDSLGTFNEIKKGKISQIDASNPLRVLLFFSDYNQIVVLNNMLTQKNVIRLNTAGFNNTNCIANSADGNFWLYDAGQGALIKSDEQLNIKQNTNLRNFDQNPSNAIYMIESDRSVYISDSVEGIRKFDQFGFYVNTYHLSANQFQLINGQLIYLSLPYLNAYNTNSFAEKKLLLPSPSDILNVRLERNRLFILRHDKIDIYTMNEY